MKVKGCVNAEPLSDGIPYHLLKLGTLCPKTGPANFRSECAAVCLIETDLKAGFCQKKMLKSQYLISARSQWLWVLISILWLGGTKAQWGRPPLCWYRDLPFFFTRWVAQNLQCVPSDRESTALDTQTKQGSVVTFPITTSPSQPSCFQIRGLEVTQPLALCFKMKKNSAKSYS